MSQSNHIIEIRNVSKFFGTKKVLDNINLSIKQGEFVTILGPSGCGKTTLLKILAGFRSLNQGEIQLNGQDLIAIPPHQRPINTVFQSYALFPHLDVYDNIAFGLKLKKMSEDEIDKEVVKALKMVGMSDYEERDVMSLSGGQQQRVAVARAIVNKPQVLLLDEPLAALDLKTRRDMQIELKQIHRNLGITFLYVTHDQEEALTLSDTVIVMSDGRIQQIGTPKDIYNEPINAFVADFIGESNILNGVMLRDELVSFAGHTFACVDKDFGTDAPVDVVLRPEDFDLCYTDDPNEFGGRVISSIFKGKYYEIRILTDTGYEILAQNILPFDEGPRVGVSIDPFDIHVMHKQRLNNRFEATVVDGSHIDLLGIRVETLEQTTFAPGDEVIAEIDFDGVKMHDVPQSEGIDVTVRSILHKGDHYHVRLMAPDKSSIYADTDTLLSKWDQVEISFLKDKIRLIATTDHETTVR